MKRPLPPETPYFGRRLSGDRGEVLGVIIERVINGMRYSLPLHPSLRLRNHSPTGFEWGYLGSGPSQLALALVLDALLGLYPDDVAMRKALASYQWFKGLRVCCWGDTWSITAQQIRDDVAEFLKDDDADASSIVEAEGGAL